MKRLRSREARKLTWCGTAGEDLESRDRRPLLSKVGLGSGDFLSQCSP